MRKWFIHESMNPWASTSPPCS